MYILIYESETVVWKEKEIFVIRIVQMDNLRSFLIVRRIS